jgi:hypothetical protein
MKNKLFSFQVFALILAIVLGQANLMATKIVTPQADLAAQFEGWTFHGEGTISPAVSGYSVTNIMPLFSGLDGLEHAQLQASIDDEGEMLLVVLTNVSVSTLPANVTLGYVTISDGDNERVFVVKADGGTVLSTLEDI